MATGRRRPVAVAGASGYAGLELLRLLARHPGFEVVRATSERAAGEPVAAHHPSLGDAFGRLAFEPLDPDRVALGVEAVFLALPHTAAMGVVPRLLETGVRVFDLSADFRLRDPAVYETWYRTAHRAPELLAGAVYGLPEIHRERLAAARLVAVPGCYPTAAILAAAPLVAGGAIDPATLVIDAKSGISGAGRKVELAYLFCEADGGVTPYGVGHHRHTPEIEQELSALAGRPVRVSFTPHLVPMSRGILVTLYASLARPAGRDDLAEAFGRFYAGSPSVRLLPAGRWPGTQHVRGSNRCDLGLAVDARVGRVVVAAAIDNLVKGAAGQAIQCANLAFGFPEALGLEDGALFP
ncbi:MAG TPA: N-acetyl-gamma-glutamyl-phosphate reductase [Thermodesulfobacteriota bacterium]|nr:N-acetyl-gamma-glutamyl-phosphate reductase [Thermodesulfobacteriota bacterium]